LYNVNSTLYSIGRSRYSQNLDLLVPFFESPSLELESIEKVKFCQPLELLFVLHFVTPLLFSDVHSWKCVSYFFFFDFQLVLMKVERNSTLWLQRLGIIDIILVLIYSLY
jgi:hypothetical protein